MMKRTDFPYPVLQMTNESGYLDEVTLEISCHDPQARRDYYKFDFEIVNTSESLNKLLKENKCGFTLAYSTKNFRSAILDFKEEEDVRFDLSYFELEDEIEFTLFIVAKQNFILEWNEEMIENYNVGEGFKINKNDILAVSNTLAYWYNVSGDSIIKLQSVADDNNFRGFIIDPQEEYIYVKVNKEFNENYQLIQKSDSIGATKTILSTSFVYIVLINVFLKLITDKENHALYSNKRWYIIISNTFTANGVDFEMEIMDTDINDINKIYELVDKFLNRGFERTLKSSSDKVRKL